MITVEILQKCEEQESDTDKLKDLTKSVCKQFDLKNANISIALVDDEHMIELNNQFLQKNETTDVLSFDLTESEKDTAKSFELIINIQKAEREAKARNHSRHAELALYIVHGLLHNLGFDDYNEEKSEQMHNREDQILQSNGFGRVYGNKE